MRPRRNGRHFPDDISKCIFLPENVWISIKIPLKFVPKGSINNIPALFQIMGWRRPDDKPLSETMMVTSLTHICVTRPQWVDTPDGLDMPQTIFITVSYDLTNGSCCMSLYKLCPFLVYYTSLHRGCNTVGHNIICEYDNYSLYLDCT